MFSGLSRAGRVVPSAVHSIIRVTTSVLSGCAELRTSTTQQSEAAAPICIVLQDRSQSQLQTEEALCLARTFAGERTSRGYLPARRKVVWKSVQCMTMHVAKHVSPVKVHASPNLVCRWGVQGGQGRPCTGAAAASKHILWQGRCRLAAAAHCSGQT